MLQFLLQALDVHMKAASFGDPEAHEAILAALQGLHTLKSTPAGVQAIMAEPGSLAGLCRVLKLGGPEAAQVVLDMLLHILIFSGEGYVMVLQVSSMAAFLARNGVINDPSSFATCQVSGKQLTHAIDTRFRLKNAQICLR